MTTDEGDERIRSLVDDMRQGLTEAWDRMTGELPVSTFLRAGPRPEPRLLRNPRDGEVAARDWLRYWGFVDAEVTRSGKDEGIDVEGDAVLAQVKMEAKPSTRVQLQLLSGAAAVARHKQLAFFSLAGYTADALDWAAKVGMAVFMFDLGTAERSGDF